MFDLRKTPQDPSCELYGRNHPMLEPKCPSKQEHPRKVRTPRPARRNLHWVPDRAAQSWLHRSILRIPPSPNIIFRSVPRSAATRHMTSCAQRSECIRGILAEEAPHYRPAKQKPCQKSVARKRSLEKGAVNEDGFDEPMRGHFIACVAPAIGLVFRLVWRRYLRLGVAPGRSS